MTHQIEIQQQIAIQIELIEMSLIQIDISRTNEIFQVEIENG